MMISPTKRMAHNEANKNIRINFIEVIIFAMLCLSPFFRGLYFNEETLISTMVIGILLVLFIFKRFDKENIRLEFIDIGFLGLTLWYILSVPFAVNTGDAIVGAIKFLAVASFYFVVSRSLNEISIRVGCWLLLGTGAFITYTGIGSSVNFPHIEGGWGETLSSWLQYHNALGGYLLMIVPLGIYLYKNSKRSLNRIIALGLVFFNVLGLFGSLSRGAYVFYGLILILLIIGFEKKERFYLSFGIFLINVIALITWNLTLNAGMNKSFLVLLWPMLGSCVVIIFDGLYLWLSSKIVFKRVANRKLVFIMILLLVMASGFNGMKLMNTQSLLNNSSVITRIKMIDINDRNFQERVAFYSDALELIKPRPIFGLGPNGWLSSYKSVQSYVYYSQETHSQPIKVLVDTGYPGLIMYFVLILGVFLNWVKTWKDRSANISYVLGVGAIGVLLHSMIDFELSENAIFYTLVFLLGCIRANNLNMAKKEKPVSPYQEFNINPAIIKMILITLASILIIVSPLLRLSLHYGKNGVEQFNQGKFVEGMSQFKLASTLNPFDGSIIADLAQLELQKGLSGKDSSSIKSAFEKIERAQDIDEYNADFRSIAANMYSANGQYEMAYKKAEEALKLQSLYPNRYEELAQYSLIYAKYLIQIGDKETAYKLLNDVTNIPDNIQKRLNRLSETQKKLWISEPKLTSTPSPQLKKMIDEAHVLLKS